MLRRSIKNLRESQYTKGRDTMSMRRKARLHEEEEKELTLQEKIEKICNDKKLFKENIWNLRLSEVYIECGQDLKEYADDTEWWGEKFFQFVLKSLKDNNENNEPLTHGDLDCYYLFDNEDYDASLYTFYDEDEWIEAVREMCCDKEIWDYDNEYIVDDEDELILE